MPLSPKLVSPALVRSRLLTGAAGPGSVVAPDDISGLQFWVRSDLGVTKDGSDNVSAWADQSGNGRNVSEATNQPLWVDNVINGKPVIRFDGSNDTLASANWTLAQPSHWFCVFRLLATPAANAAVVYGDNDATTAQPNSMNITTTPTLRPQGNGVNGVASGTLSTSTTYLAEMFFNGTNCPMVLNNTSYASSGANLTATIDGVILGSRTGTNFCNCEIAEVAIYNAEVTGDNLLGLRHSYFNKRYGVF